MCTGHAQLTKGEFSFTSFIALTFLWSLQFFNTLGFWGMWGMRAHPRPRAPSGDIPAVAWPPHLLWGGHAGSSAVARAVGGHPRGCVAISPSWVRGICVGYGGCMRVPGALFTCPPRVACFGGIYAVSSVVRLPVEGAFGPHSTRSVLSFYLII